MKHGDKIMLFHTEDAARTACNNLLNVGGIQEFVEPHNGQWRVGYTSLETGKVLYATLNGGFRVLCDTDE